MKLFPNLRYRDARAGIAWLEAAFGFETKALHEGEGGGIAHAEVAWGPDRLMIGEAGTGLAVPEAGATAVYFSCPDPDALFERATAAGGEVVYAPRDTDYGAREAAVRDPDGNVWSFGTYEPA